MWKLLTNLMRVGQAIHWDDLAEHFKTTADGIRIAREDIEDSRSLGTYEINIPKLEKYFQAGIFGNFDRDQRP